MEPTWMRAARKYVGQREIKGLKHNSTILQWWQRIKLNIFDDETAWCAAFVGGVLEEVGIRSTRSASARSYVRWGTKLNAPCVGAIVSFWRGSPNGWQGHVGFVAGRDKKGNLVVLGGNQGDSVSFNSFDVARVLAYSWPIDATSPPTGGGFNTLPILTTDGRLSTNEA